MKKGFLLLMFFCIVVPSGFSQSDTTSRRRERKEAILKNFGIGFGVSYSLLNLKSEAFLLNQNTGKLGNSHIKNKMGASVSLFSNINLGEQWKLRPTIEAHFLQATILYDTELINKKSSSIFPVAIEFPMTVIRNFSNNQGNENLNLLAGVRPSVALKQVSSLYPQMKSFNLNVEAGVGVPVRIGNFKLRIEAIYSHGLFNLIEKNTDDFYTNSISYLGRNFAGFRFYFN